MKKETATGEQVSVPTRSGKERIQLFGKGIVMGVADIIPGVSGGTLALILGIYIELVNTIKGLHLRWVPRAWKWVRQGFNREVGAGLLSELKAMNLSFLMVLVAGIAVAIGAGGMVLPGLLERYPEAMRGLFFGLILASVPVPFRLIVFTGRRSRYLVALMVGIGLVLGWLATAPDRAFETATTWTVVEASEGDTLKTITRREPSVWPAERVYWADENESMRQAMMAANPGVGMVRPGDVDAVLDREVVKQRSLIYEEMSIPAGVPVHLPQPAIWFVFVAGMIGICAMILPGISGSYLLLILGVYYFVLSALKGVLTGLAVASPPPSALFFVVVFMAGMVVGILSFARVMSFLLKRYPAPTLGILIGLLVGCLRGIWPFQSLVDGQVVNVLPTNFDATVVSAVVAAMVGAIVVTLLARLGRARNAAGRSGKGR